MVRAVLNDSQKCAWVPKQKQSRVGSALEWVLCYLSCPPQRFFSQPTSPLLAHSVTKGSSLSESCQEDDH